LHNQYVNGVRRSARAGSPTLLDEASELGKAPEQQGALKLRDLRNALARLPEEQHAVILLVGLEGLAYDQAAEVLGIPIGTVRSRLSRARIALRQMMEGHAPQSGRGLSRALPITGDAAAGEI
jgi:RNA polymerase sigma-70 factor (ECF subfamily)